MASPPRTDGGVLGSAFKYTTAQNTNTSATNNADRNTASRVPQAAYLGVEIPPSSSLPSSDFPSALPSPSPPASTSTAACPTIIGGVRSGGEFQPFALSEEGCGDGSVSGGVVGQGSDATSLRSSYLPGTSAGAGSKRNIRNLSLASSTSDATESGTGVECENRTSSKQSPIASASVSSTSPSSSSFAPAPVTASTTSTTFHLYTGSSPASGSSAQPLSQPYGFTPPIRLTQPRLPGNTGFRVASRPSPSPSTSQGQTVIAPGAGSRGVTGENTAPSTSHSSPTGFSSSTPPSSNFGWVQQRLGGVGDSYLNKNMNTSSETHAGVTVNMSSGDKTWPSGIATIIPATATATAPAPAPPPILPSTSPSALENTDVRHSRIRSQTQDQTQARLPSPPAPEDGAAINRFHTVSHPRSESFTSRSLFNQTHARAQAQNQNQMSASASVGHERPTSLGHGQGQAYLSESWRAGPSSMTPVNVLESRRLSELERVLEQEMGDDENGTRNSNSGALGGLHRQSSLPTGWTTSTTGLAGSALGGTGYGSARRGKSWVPPFRASCRPSYIAKNRAHRPSARKFLIRPLSIYPQVSSSHHPRHPPSQQFLDEIPKNRHSLVTRRSRKKAPTCHPLRHLLAPSTALASPHPLKPLL